jgi:hypothetical protein
MGDKTQINTFRLPATLVEELKKEAGLEKINLNALVLKILANHVLWGRYERKVGLLPMTKPFVKAAIQRLDNDEIIKLALNIEKETFSDILHFMRAWLNVAWMQHNIEQTNNSYVFKIQHDLGDKWSLYVETLIKELFADILKKKLEIKSKKGNIMLIFPSE